MKKYKLVCIEMDNNERTFISSATQGEIKHFVRNNPNFVKRIRIFNKKNMGFEELKLPKFQVRVIE